MNYNHKYNLNLNELEAIELASFNSWPALEQEILDNWYIRFSNGYTKRANSVNILKNNESDLLDKINYCEEYYKSKKQPVIFRLVSFYDNEKLMKSLTEKEYIKIDDSSVLYQNISNSNIHMKINSMTLEDWLTPFCEIYKKDINLQKEHISLLNRIDKSQILYHLIKDENQNNASCGVGVIDNKYFGIFDIGTNEKQRKKGFGIRLLREMLHWAKNNGSTKAYVQVLSSNQNALNLYKKLGYNHCYNYWYMIKEV